MRLYCQTDAASYGPTAYYVPLINGDAASDMDVKIKVMDVYAAARRQKRELTVVLDASFMRYRVAGKEPTTDAAWGKLEQFITELAYDLGPDAYIVVRDAPLVVPGA